jgi:hypothetical protein
MSRLDPAAQRRLESCLNLARSGSTAGERAAGRAAAERIATAAGLTLAEARRLRTKIRRPSPPTVADRLREKTEQAATRRRRAAAADRRFWKDYADHAAWEAEQQEAQAERDRAWAACRATVA